MAMTLCDQNNKTNPAILSATKLSVNQTASGFHKTDRTSKADCLTNMTKKSTITERVIYKEPVYVLAKIENQAKMQFFGGKTGGSEI